MRERRLEQAVLCPEVLIGSPEVSARGTVRAWVRVALPEEAGGLELLTERVQLSDPGALDACAGRAVAAYRASCGGEAAPDLDRERLMASLRAGCESALREGDWPEARPLPSTREERAAFPADALPGWLAEWTGAVADALQVPPDLPGMLGLSAVALCAARRFETAIRPGWQEQLNLYTLVVLPSGHRKSETYRLAMAPIDACEAALQESERLGIARQRARYKLLEDRLREAQDRAAKGGHDKEVERAAEALASSRVPHEPQLTSDDVTPEQVATMLCHNDGAIGVMSPEPSLFDLIAGRYNSGKPNFDVFLKGHVGDTIRVDRRGRVSEHVAHPAITISLTAQPKYFQSVFGNPVFRDRGLLGRFLYAVPQSLFGTRRSRTAAVPEAMVVRYAELLTRLLGVPRCPGGGRWVLPWTEAASEALVGLQDELEPRLAEDGDLGHMTDWAAKLPGSVARISALLRLAELVADAPERWRPERWEVDAPLRPVEERHVQAALRLGRYLLEHARRAYGGAPEDAQLLGAARVLKWIRTQEVTDFSEREAWRALRGSFERMAILRSCLQMLRDLGHLRERPSEHTYGPGRPPGVRYLVNPRSSGSGTDGQNGQNR